MAQIANMPDGSWKTNAKEALTHLTARYASLSVYAEKIMKQAKLSNSTVPCSVLEHYNQAVNDYLSFGRRLFDLLYKNKMNVEQVVYRGGKPVTDDKGKIKTLRINAPLRPLTFILTKTQCPGVTRITGTEPTIQPMIQGNTIGFEPISISLFAAYVVGGLLIVGVSGYVLNKLAEKIIIGIRGPIYTPDQVVSAYVKCLDGVSAHIAKTYPNMAPADRDRMAASLAKDCAEKSKGESGSSSLPFILLGAAAVAGGIFLFSKGGGGAA